MIEINCHFERDNMASVFCLKCKKYKSTLLVEYFFPTETATDDRVCSCDEPNLVLDSNKNNFSEPRNDRVNDRKLLSGLPRQLRIKLYFECLTKVLLDNQNICGENDFRTLQKAKLAYTLRLLDEPFTPKLSVADPSLELKKFSYFSCIFLQSRLSYKAHIRAEIAELLLKTYGLIHEDVWLPLKIYLNINLKKRKSFKYFGITFYYIDRLTQRFYYRLEFHNEKIKCGNFVYLEDDERNYIEPRIMQFEERSNPWRWLFTITLEEKLMEDLHFINLTKAYCDEALIDELGVIMTKIIDNYYESMREFVEPEREEIGKSELAQMLGYYDEDIKNMTEDEMWEGSGLG